MGSNPLHLGTRAIYKGRPATLSDCDQNQADSCELLRDSLGRTLVVMLHFSFTPGYSTPEQVHLMLSRMFGQPTRYFHMQRST